MGQAGIHDLGEGSSHVGIKEMLLVTGALTQRYFQHRDAFTQVLLHVNTSTLHSAFRTHSFTLRFLYTQALLHRGTLTHSGRHVYMQILVHAGVDFASQGCL